MKKVKLMLGCVFIVLGILLMLQFDEFSEYNPLLRFIFYKNWITDYYYNKIGNGWYETRSVIYFLVSIIGGCITVLSGAALILSEIEKHLKKISRKSQTSAL